MKLYVGRITASCIACGCDDWHLTDAAQSFSVLSEVRCAACGNLATYADLTLQTPFEAEQCNPGATAASS